MSQRTLDVGCGEGRLPRELTLRGYAVTAIDSSATLVEHARETDPQGDYRIADAASLPLSDGSVELVTAFMSLHDIDDMNEAVNEAARVLTADLSPSDRDAIFSGTARRTYRLP